ncbi:hypothetical protein AAG570_007125 [Ranatra chinensis]|uniref:XK-related protein n=1 Tax=Ranatra chinensis TaxID=642074 RepID=A0ABD0YGT0_9HEMI
MAQNEFLPLCDVLFNIISLASYFCDIVFDLVMGYALMERGRTFWFIVTLMFVALSLTISQVVSLRWYLHGSAGGGSGALVKRLGRAGVVALHCAQLGVLWRYFKLFLPCDLRFVKYEVRDLCMLRLVHAFCQAAPMLLVQLYLLMEDAADLREFRDLNVVSVSLSLFSVCWALASFSKNVRMHNVHKLVLTWLGVIFQLFWRLGTVSGRAVCLVAYALLYRHWVLLVILLHWFCMFLWLVSPNNLFHRERLSRPRKATLCSLIAFVYVFAYINLQEANHRPKMVTFYGVMAIENSVLMYSWYSGTPGSGQTLPLTALAVFLIGLLFMFLYYRYFHVRRLKYEAGGRLNGPPLAMPLTPDAKVTYRSVTSPWGSGWCGR